MSYADYAYSELPIFRTESERVRDFPTVSEIVLLLGVPWSNFEHSTESDMGRPRKPRPKVPNEAADAINVRFGNYYDPELLAMVEHFQCHDWVRRAMLSTPPSGNRRVKLRDVRADAQTRSARASRAIRRELWRSSQRTMARTFLLACYKAARRLDAGFFARLAQVMNLPASGEPKLRRAADVLDAYAECCIDREERLSPGKLKTLARFPTAAEVAERLSRLSPSRWGSTGGRGASGRVKQVEDILRRFRKPFRPKRLR
jgi:hypothetical protein